jgi:type IV pilus assembly protein PilQ
MKKLILVLLFGFGLLLQSFAQDRIEQLRMKLEAMAVDIPGLEQTLQMSVSGVKIQDFLATVAENHKLNISIDPQLAIDIYNNFSDARVLDVLLFVCRNYNLDVEFTGSIMYFKKYTEPVLTPKPYEAKKPKVEYFKETNFLSLDLKKDSIEYVVREITTQSYYNVLVGPSARGMQLSAFIANRPFVNALELLCDANGLKLVPKTETVFLLEKGDALTVNSSINSGAKTGLKTPEKQVEGLDVKLSSRGLLNVRADNVPIKDIIRQVSSMTSRNYFLFNEPTGNTSLFVENAHYDDFLNYLLMGTNYTYKMQDSIYMIGERKLEGLRETRMIKLKYRPVEKIMTYIPAELKKDLEIQEFIELNGLICSGSFLKIAEIEAFLRQIDQLVPVVMIEVIIIESRRSNNTTTGVDAGLGKNPNTTATNGSVTGVNLEISPATINSIINGFNTLGILNLGKVSSSFYMSVQALESSGNIHVKSVPKISTLNGNLATMKVGSQEYYLETTQNVYASNTTQTTLAKQYKSVNADLTVKIKPFVSDDNQVTLTISVEQSDFTAKIEPTAPPGQVTRMFDSMIRVKDGEMIVLGGLEEKSTEDSSSGLPGVSRVKVLRSIFGKNTRSKSKSQLTVFIKPTIVY